MAKERLIDLWGVNMEEVDTSDCTDVEDILSAVITYLSERPTVDAVEVVHGRWIVDDSGVIICSECGAEHEWQDYRATFCEDCGAKMDGANDDGYKQGYENSYKVGFNADKWLSVKDRLPEDDLPKNTKKKMIRCLVYTDKGTIKPCVRQRWEHFDGQLVPWQWSKDLYAKPTHWMYYPQPPKGE